MKREDSEAMKSLQKLGFEINDYLKLPLLVIPSTHKPSDWKDYFDTFKNKEITCDEYLFRAGELAPFKEFVFIILSEYQMFSYGKACFTEEKVSFEYYRITHHDNMEGFVAAKIYAQVTDDGFDAQVVETRIYKEDTIAPSALEVIHQANATYKNKMFVTGAILKFLEFAYECDKYPVLVHRTKKDFRDRKLKSKNQLYKSQSLSKLIYLNTLPLEVSDTRNGTGAPKRPHQRRGCFKTLRAERFRNHPQFQVPNGIYCRPAFVGPKESIVAGNRYTIITGAK